LIRSDPHAKQTRIPRSLQEHHLFDEQDQLFDTYFNVDELDPFTVTEKHGKQWLCLLYARATEPHGLLCLLVTVVVRAAATAAGS
jgi:hypothetical protein